ncbi:MAG: DsbA family protein [Alphaproteobacteria bacterium]|nr:DsbA family protein [Alphaproteobacteria bacterium]
MRKSILFPSLATVVVLIVAGGIALFSTKAPAESFSDAQRAEIETIVKTYITEKNPGVLKDALVALQIKSQKEAEGLAKEKIKAEKDRIFNNPSSPISGNPNGEIKFVEFYDYRCGYCKHVEEIIEQVIKENKDVKFVYKNFPILGDLSHEAALAAMASVKQGKFEAFHDALMKKKGALTSKGIDDVAKTVGLDTIKLRADMKDPAIEKAIEEDIRLGQELGVQGTPFFIIEETSIPGAVDYDRLTKIIDAERSNLK